MRETKSGKISQLDIQASTVARSYVRYNEVTDGEIHRGFSDRRKANTGMQAAAHNQSYSAPLATESHNIICNSLENHNLTLKCMSPIFNLQRDACNVFVAHCIGALTSSGTACLMGSSGSL